MTDLVRRSLDTLIGMQQELLTTTSKETLQWLESEKTGKSDRTTQLDDCAREGVETFARTQKQFFDAVAQETAKATSGEAEHESKAAKKPELADLAQEAGNAFIEAQKRLLDVMGQQMNVNADVAIRTAKTVSPTQLMPMAVSTSEGVKNFFDAETSLIGSFIKAPKAKAAGRVGTAQRPRDSPAKEVAV